MRHFNNTINKSMADTFNLKGESTDEIMNEIVPVIVVEPKVDIFINSAKTTTGANTIYTTPTTKDFFLTGILISYVKDAVCDVADGVITLNTTIDGLTRFIISLPVLTLTAQQDEKVIIFNKPIKIDRGVTFNYSGTFGAGKMIRECSIIGYTVETVKNT